VAGRRELLRDDAPDTVVDVRGKGLMLAVEFDTAERRAAVVEASLDRGLLTLGCGKTTIRLLPARRDRTRDRARHGNLPRRDRRRERASATAT